MSKILSGYKTDLSPGPVTVPDFTDFFFFGLNQDEDLLLHPNVGLASEIYQWLKDWREAAKPTVIGSWDYLFEQAQQEWWQEKTAAEQADYLYRLFDLFVPEFDLVVPEKELDNYIGVSISDMPHVLVDLGPKLDLSKQKVVFKWREVTNE